MSAIVWLSLGEITRSYLILLAWQTAFWSISRYLFPKSSDRGWSIARPLGIVIVSLITWNLGNLGLGVNNIFFIAFWLLLALATSLFIAKKTKKDPITNKELKVIIMSEYVFVAMFFLISFVRGYLPHLDSLEKFMDYGFVNSYLRSNYLPAQDMWYAGETINYYSFGHFWASILIRSLGVTSSVGYNLTLGFIAGTIASLCLVLVVNLTAKSKRSLIGGFLASILMVFGGNGYTIWYLLKNHGFGGFWYADATRFIYNTIHEFPSYSLIVSDLHGHILNLPYVLLFLIVLNQHNRERSYKWLVMLGVLFGVMMMSNTWDVLIFGMAISIYYLGLVWQKKITFLKSTVDAAVVGFSMILVSITWWREFTPIASGINLVTLRSPLWQLAVLWSLLALVGCLEWFMVKKNIWVIKTLVVLMFLLVAIPEIIYFKDIYPDHPRANTMFKLTYQAFVVSILTFGVLVANVLESRTALFKRTVLYFLIIVIFGSSIMFSALAYPSYYGNFKEYHGLNGEEWLMGESIIKWDILEYIRKNDDGRNIVEAVGDSYTHKNVVSAYTGIPTIQGWRVHEWLWRGGWDKVATREKLVNEIYEGVSTEETRKIISNYNVGKIIVGPDEDEAYLINHKKIKELGNTTSFSEDYYVVTVE